MISQNRLKLLVFWAKHMWRTSRGVDDPSEVDTKTCKTVSGVVAYTNPKTGRTIHLIINQAIHVPHLDHHLLCPMQCHVNDVIVDKMPKLLAIKPTDQMHALTVSNLDDTSQLTLPITLRGVTLLLM